MPTLFRSDAFKVSAYVLAVVLLGALLAPQLHTLGQWALAKGIFDSGPLESVKDSVERAKITRYFNRAVMLAALLLAWPFLRWIGIRREGNWLQLRKNPNPLGQFGFGFGLAAGTLLLLGAIYVGIGWYRWNDEAKPLYRMILSSIGPGLSVAFLEEFLFRGVLLALILRTLRPFPALVFLSSFFAIVHFLKPPEKLKLPPVEWDTGFWLLTKIFGQLGSVDFLLAELVLLFCVGWVLGWKLFSAATRKAAAIADMMPFAGPHLRVGFNSVVVVCLCGLIVWLWLKKRYPVSAFTPMPGTEPKEDVPQN